MKEDNNIDSISMNEPGRKEGQNKMENTKER